ncbi:MAG: 50S ribosomal protein L32 [Proteobacteria bacterium]|nr:50S ribosomal protein L32 [Pseudomonadota bacterium]
MAVPKKKKSKSCRNMRRSHHALKGINLVEDPTTGELKLPHRATTDGYYKGRQIFVAPEATAAGETK